MKKIFFFLFEDKDIMLSLNLVNLNSRLLKKNCFYVIKSFFSEDHLQFTKIENEGVRSIFPNRLLIKLRKCVLWIIPNLFIVCFVEITKASVNIYIINEDFSNLEVKK